MVKLNPELVARMRARRAESVEWQRGEFWSNVELVADALPEWRDHPWFVPILWKWYSPIAGSIPAGWYRSLTKDCRRFFKRLPWQPRDDGECISVGRCRELLGREGKTLSDEHVRLVRDQLYALSSIVLTSRGGKKK